MPTIIYNTLPTNVVQIVSQSDRENFKIKNVCLQLKICLCFTVFSMRIDAYFSSPKSYYINFPSFCLCLFFFDTTNMFEKFYNICQSDYKFLFTRRSQQVSRSCRTVGAGAGTKDVSPQLSIRLCLTAACFKSRKNIKSFSTIILNSGVKTTLNFEIRAV